MSNLKKILAVILVILGLGAIAKVYNTHNHHQMALEQCGSEENIHYVNSKRFECRSGKKQQ